MNDNIQIINKSGEGMSTEGISYIEVPSTTKKYLFYTLNEKVDNDLTKIYIAETNTNGVVENSISDAEWDNLRQKMIKISHKEAVEDVKFLSMNGVQFNVGDPKKLAITAVAKQAFKDAQISNTMATNQTATPVTTGSTSSFFNQDVVGNQTAQVETPSTEQSIFANPPQPQTVANPPSLEPSMPSVANLSVEQAPAIPNAIDATIAPQVNASVQENLASSGTITSSIGLTEEPVNSPQNTQTESLPQSAQPIENTNQVDALNQQFVIPNLVEQAPAQDLPATPDVPLTPNLEASPAPIPQDSGLNAFNIPSMPESVAAVSQVQEIPAQPLENKEQVQPEKQELPKTTPVTQNNRTIITDEEALKAINTIQEYINQESENNNQ